MARPAGTCSLGPGAGMKIRNNCDKCAVRHRALCSAVSDSAALALSRMAHFRRIPAGQVIQSDAQELSWCAVIISGVVKLVKSQRDGRQQIVGLLFPSDFVGRPYAMRTSVIAEATTNLELCCFSKIAFEGLMEEHKPLEQELLRRALDDLDTSREWMFVLGRKTAREKVASLLYFIAGRMVGACSEVKGAQSKLEFDLPLSRTEMADCLGLTIETVSREIRHLKSRGLIATRGRRHVTVCALGALRSLAESEQA